MAGILAKMAAAQKESRSSGRPQNILNGGVSVKITEIDKKNQVFGWLMKGIVVGGERGVGEEFYFAFGKKENLNRVIESQLGPKTKVGAVVHMQDVEAPVGTGTAAKPVKIRRMLGLNLDGRSQTMFNTPTRITMFKSGAYQASFANPESKTRIDSLAALKERVMADMNEGMSTVLVGAIDGQVITNEAYLGQIRGEGNAYVPEDKEVAYKRFTDRLFEGLDLEDPEVIESIDAEMAASEVGFSAYSVTNVNIFGKTKQVMIEALQTGGRPNHIPLDVMFPRSIGERVAAAKRSLSDKQMDTLTQEFLAWAEKDLSVEELEAFNEGGFDEVSESKLAKFMINSGIELPERAQGQATSWNSAVERLANSNMTSIRTGWNICDASIDNHINSGEETLDYFYVRSIAVHAGGRNKANVFFPDESTKDQNREYVYGLTDRLKEFADNPEAHKEAAAAKRAERAGKTPAPGEDAKPGAAAPEADTAAEDDVDARFMNDPADPGVNEDEMAAAIEGSVGAFDLND